MKRGKIVEGIKGIIQKLTKVTSSLIKKIKKVGKLELEVATKGSEGEHVFDTTDVRKELSSIEVVKQEELYQNRSKHQLEEQTEEGVDLDQYAKQLEVAKALQSQLQEMEKLQYEDLPLQEQLQEQLQEKSNVIYFNAIPAVIKIDKQQEIKMDKQQEIKKIMVPVIDFSRVWRHKYKNKGSILPLHRGITIKHRCITIKEQRGKVHQREPTWKQM